MSKSNINMKRLYRKHNRELRKKRERKQALFAESIVTFFDADGDMFTVPMCVLEECLDRDEQNV